MPAAADPAPSKDVAPIAPKAYPGPEGPGLRMPALVCPLLSRNRLARLGQLRPARRVGSLADLQQLAVVGAGGRAIARERGGFRGAVDGAESIRLFFQRRLEL